jgi:hypothetical protein
MRSLRAAGHCSCPQRVPHREAQNRRGPPRLPYPHAPAPYRKPTDSSIPIRSYRPTLLRTPVDRAPQPPATTGSSAGRRLNPLRAPGVFRLLEKPSPPPVVVFALAPLGTARLKQKVPLGRGSRRPSKRQRRARSSSPPSACSSTAPRPSDRR